MKILVTGAAGFIGYHTAEKLVKRGETVIGLDNFNDYYDVSLKEARAARLADYSNFKMVRADLVDRAAMEALFTEHKFDKVVHLAAQAGVRYSIENPHAYIDSNIVGTLHILEGCRHHGVEHLVYASSSSVYGANTKMPFSVHQNVDHPLALYGVTKKANELMAHVYSHLHALPATGLRYFTVYGPWGRPDMSPMLFARAILEGKPIQVFNHGDMKRDFTYIDDAVEATLRVLDRPPVTTPPHRVLNVGNHQPVALLEYIARLEAALGKKAVKDMKPMQPGDVPATYADIDDLERDFGYRPKTELSIGIKAFVDWYRDFYKV